MLDTIQHAASMSSRFDQLLAPDPSEHSLWNTVLAKTSDYLVVPTLGSIIPHWHLVIPREPSINIHQHLTAKGTKDIRRIVAPIVEAQSPRQLLWFEHGPRFPGSVVGCGTDYAHLHVILDAPFGFCDFQRAAGELSASWTEYDIETAYGEIDDCAEYYAFGDLSTAFVSQRSLSPTSQLFRKVVANLVGKPDQWDYRLFTHEECIRSTIKRWEML
jgi:energy-converting hydrogenase Eha subunit A